MSRRLPDKPSGQHAAQIACRLAANRCMVPPMIIVVANTKGGVGKSTIAVHLAAWLNQQGHSVTLADCDMQHSSSDWVKTAAPGVKAVRLGSADEILENLPQLKNEAEYLVADGPGSNTEISRTLLLCADLAIVPCKASMLEILALSQATMALRHAQKIRKGQPQAIIVLSMVGKNYRLTRDMKEAAAALGLPMAKTALTLKQIYADAPGQSAVVWNLGARGREAALEITTFFREALPQACSRTSSKRTAKRSAG
jgi:chromosome partitioning protein